MNANERDNAIRFEAGTSGHVESLFLKLNHPVRPQALWLKFTLLAPSTDKPPRAEVWAIAFDAERPSHPIAVKASYPAETASYVTGVPGIVVGDSRLATGATSGVVEHAGHTITWDLRLRTSGEPFRSFHFERLHETALPSFKLCSPYPNARVDGHFVVDGQRIDVADWFGAQGHNWGKRHAVRYAWAHCNCFDDAPDDTFFEGWSGRVKLGPFTTPWVTRTHLRVGGDTYPFFSLRSLLNQRVAVDYHHWSFVSRARGVRLEGSFDSDPNATAVLEYPDPDGSIAYCINCKISKMELRLFRGSILEHHLVSRHGAALETLVREPTHGLPILLSGE